MSDFGPDAVLGPPERAEIARRTRAAMQAAKAQGTRHGRPVTLPEPLRQRIVAMRDDGMTYREIAGTLNDLGVSTARGGARWWPSTVASVLDSVRRDREAEAARERPT